MILPVLANGKHRVACDRYPGGGLDSSAEKELHLVSQRGAILLMYSRGLRGVPAKDVAGEWLGVGSNPTVNDLRKSHLYSLLIFQDG